MKYYMTHENLMNYAIERVKSIIIHFTSTPQQSKFDKYFICTNRMVDDTGFNVLCTPQYVVLLFCPKETLDIDGTLTAVRSLQRVLWESKIVRKLKITYSFGSINFDHLDLCVVPILETAVNCLSLCHISINTQFHYEDKHLRPILKQFTNHQKLETIQLHDIYMRSPTVRKLRVFFKNDFQKRQQCTMLLMCYYLSSSHRTLPFEMVQMILNYINPRSKYICIRSRDMLK